MTPYDIRGVHYQTLLQGSLDLDHESGYAEYPLQTGRRVPSRRAHDQHLQSPECFSSVRASPTGLTELSVEGTRSSRSTFHRPEG